MNIKTTVDQLIAGLGIKDFANATIREVKQVAAETEKLTGVEFIKMEMGIPGLPPSPVGVEAQKTPSGEASPTAIPTYRACRS